MNDKVELVGECWTPDVACWDNCKRFIPRSCNPDDYTALAKYVEETISKDILAESTGIDNFAALAGRENKPLIYAVWPTPNKGYNAIHLINIWEQIRKNCFLDSH